jgi:hypothetical protein
VTRLLELGSPRIYRALMGTTVDLRPVRAASTSGRVEVAACAAADVATSSGRISLRGADGPVNAHCVSGRIVVELLGAHDVIAETVSGRIEVLGSIGATCRAPGSHARSSHPRTRRAGRRETPCQWCVGMPWYAAGDAVAKTLRVQCATHGQLWRCVTPAL